VQTVIGAAITVISTLWDTFGTTIQTTISNAWTVITTIITGAINTVEGIIGGFIDLITGNWDQLGTDLGNTWNTIWNTIISAITGFGKTIWDAITGLVTGIVGKFTSIDWGGIGKAMMQGVVDGIKSMAGTLLNAALSVVTGPLDAVKGLLGIHSPSVVFAEQVGKPIVQGIVQGISQTAPQLTGAATGAVAVAVQASKQAAGNNSTTATTNIYNQQSYSLNNSYGGVAPSNALMDFRLLQQLGSRT
jgi:phage-related protein